MEDTLPEIENQPKLLCKLLQDHLGQDVIVLDLRPFKIWTDFFIIATTSSKTHMDGIERHVKDYCRQKDIAVSGSPRKIPDDEWRLLDLNSPDFGSIIIHLMSNRIREFYELERLWSVRSGTLESN